MQINAGTKIGVQINRKAESRKFEQEEFFVSVFPREVSGTKVLKSSSNIALLASLNIIFFSDMIIHRIADNSEN